ncbi:MAG: TIGR00341 family protein [Candidatus Heimdallarchaeaceae archaeon]
MKAIKIVIPSDKSEVVQDLLDQMKVQYTTNTMVNKTQIEIIINRDQTSIILEELKGIGVGSVFGSVAVTPVDLKIDSKASKFKIKSRSISVDEMIMNTQGLGVMSFTFAFLCVLAGLLSSFGLIYDNVIIVIASMIIAPLLGPIALSVIGTMLPNNIYSKRAILAEITGLLICVTIGLLIGLITPIEGNLPKQIVMRTQPGIPDIVFAIVSGLAAGIFIIRGESTNIVGVAVAASLAPPAANVGVLLAKNEWLMALGSFVLLVLNIIAIYAACALIFWSTQTFVRGGSVSERQYRKISKKYLTRIISAIVTLIVIIVVIIILFD